MALNSIRSGALLVGKSKKECKTSNRELEIVGEKVMKAVLGDQCYLFKIPGGGFLFPLNLALLWGEGCRGRFQDNT